MCPSPDSDKLIHLSPAVAIRVVHTVIHRGKCKLLTDPPPFSFAFDHELCIYIIICINNNNNSLIPYSDHNYSLILIGDCADVNLVVATLSQQHYLLEPFTDIY